MKKWLVRIAIIIVSLPIVLVLLGAAAFRLANHTNGTLVSSGQERTYLLYVPDSYEPSRPTPLVITIHGFAQWPAHQMQVTHWNDLADDHGFIVVYPSGTQFPRRWQASGTLGNAADPLVDVRFISDLIDQLESEYNIDPAHIYANGLSNGGGMTFVLACNLAERIAAIGTVAGAFYYPSEECNPARPVPAVIFHGTDDPIVPFQGGPAGPNLGSLPDIATWVDDLARRNGCDSDPVQLPPSGAVSGVQFSGCDADVVFYTISGGGHTWPGGRAIPKWLAGETTQDIDATQVMWDFFVQHAFTD